MVTDTLKCGGGGGTVSVVLNGRYEVLKTLQFNSFLLNEHIMMKCAPYSLPLTAQMAFPTVCLLDMVTGQKAQRQKT